MARGDFLIGSFDDYSFDEPTTEESSPAMEEEELSSTLIGTSEQSGVLPELDPSLEHEIEPLFGTTLQEEFEEAVIEEFGSNGGGDMEEEFTSGGLTGTNEFAITESADTLPQGGGHGDSAPSGESAEDIIGTGTQPNPEDPSLSEANASDPLFSILGLDTLAETFFGDVGEEVAERKFKIVLWVILFAVTIFVFSRAS